MRKDVLLNIGFAVFFLMIITGATGQTKQIRITDFHIEKNQNKVNISWATDKVETNYFEVEKSNDGKKFKTIAYVLGADPAKTDCDCFEFSDRVNSGSIEAYYRLKHINKNGQVQFSEVKALALNN